MSTTFKAQRFSPNQNLKNALFRAASHLNALLCAATPKTPPF